MKRFVTAAGLVAFLAAPVPAPAEDGAPELEVRVWRIEFPDDTGADIDWEAVFAGLDEGEEAGVQGSPREVPGRGRSLLEGTVPVTRWETVPNRVVAPPPARPSAPSPRLSAYPVRHRDPAEVDHIVKRLTGQISDKPTQGTLTGADVTRDWRDPVRTVPDSETGQILQTSLPRREAAVYEPVPPQPPAVPPRVAPAIQDLRTPLTPDLANLGPVALPVLAERLETQGRLKRMYGGMRQLEEGRSTHFSLPYVHSRHGGGSFTVAVELGVIPQDLSENRWVLRLKPQFLTFEQAPRTIRLLAEGVVTLGPGEVVVLSHVLATEVAEAPSMFVKDPPASRTLVLLSGLPAGGNGASGTLDNP